VVNALDRRMDATDCGPMPSSRSRPRVPCRKHPCAPMDVPAIRKRPSTLASTSRFIFCFDCFEELNRGNYFTSHFIVLIFFHFDYSINSVSIKANRVLTLKRAIYQLANGTNFQNNWPFSQRYIFTMYDGQEFRHLIACISFKMDL
jgi:hypothetical protein